MCSYSVMRSRLIVLLGAMSFGLALAIENNPVPAREVAAELARAATVGADPRFQYLGTRPGGCSIKAVAPAGLQPTLFGKAPNSNMIERRN